ncbi:MAG: hypothetical protein U9Q81_07590 [Pseudomonadota bacterium]|nr:hypothetical protein [Pseudomonadota bacterium]
MADLPAGCDLIPNPYNQIPGFSIGRHYFLPGFPQMAWPMAQGVLESHYPAAGHPIRELAVIVRRVSESRLVPLMERLTERYPQCKLFSLPHLGPDPHILLGVRGREDIGEAFSALRAQLESEGVEYELANV